MATCTDETLARANHLLRKLNLLEVELDNLPPHAPIRRRLEAEYEEKSQEYRLLITDIQDSEGVRGLFEVEGREGS